jgi:hypothetical protein
MKPVRDYGTVERRPNNKFRVRIGKKHGGLTLGTFDSKLEAEEALANWKIKENITVERYKNISNEPDQKPWAEIGLDGGEIATGTLTAPLLVNDWDAVLKSFGLDPAIFQVADDKVRMSKWMSSKRLENGDRDSIWLWSYRATFIRRKTAKINDLDIDSIRKNIRTFKPLKTAFKGISQDPSTFLFLASDWQLGKSASGGPEATVKRVLDSFEKTVKRIEELQKTGRNIEQIAFVNMGDPVEGCSNEFYPSQLFSVQLTQREQLLLALDLWTTGITMFSGLAPKIKFISTLSNHGEWNRRNGKSQSTDSDSADGFLSDTLKRILGDKNIVDEWVIPHDEMSVTSDLSGMNCAFTHGHKIARNEFEWLRGQSLRLLRDNGQEPKIWFTGHRHHIKIDDFGVFTRFQCPSQESDGLSSSSGSKYFVDTTGRWSSPGSMTLLVGRHDLRGWSDLAVL